MRRIKPYREARESLSPGVAVQLKVFREGRERVFSATLGELPAKRETAEKTALEKSSLQLGLSVAPLTPDVLRELGLAPNTSGILVAVVMRLVQAGG